MRDNLNIIFSERSDFLNDAYEFDRIKENYIYFFKHAVPLLKKLDENSFPLHLYKKKFTISPLVLQQGENMNDKGRAHNII